MRSYKNRVVRVTLMSGVSLFPIVSLLACTTVPTKYELCEPVPPATDCGDDIPVVVE